MNVDEHLVTVQAATSIANAQSPPSVSFAPVLLGKGWQIHRLYLLVGGRRCGLMHNGWTTHRAILLGSTEVIVIHLRALVVTRRFALRHRRELLGHVILKYLYVEVLA